TKNPMSFLAAYELSEPHHTQHRTPNFPIEEWKIYEPLVGKCVVVRCVWCGTHLVYFFFFQRRLPSQCCGWRSQPSRVSTAAIRRWSAVPTRCVWISSASLASWPIVNSHLSVRPRYFAIASSQASSS